MVRNILIGLVVLVVVVVGVAFVLPQNVHVERATVISRVTASHSPSVGTLECPVGMSTGKPSGPAGRALAPELP